MSSSRRPGRVGPGAALVVLCAMAMVGTMIVAGLTAAPASAHDALVSTNPANGATVASAPDRVTLTFEEPALAVGTTVRVTGPQGDVQSGAPRLVDDTVTQELAPGIPAGGYRIVWRATSADGHPVTGELTFTATAANPRSASANSPTTAGTQTASGPRTSGGSSGVWAGIVVVLVLGGGVALWLRRRRSKVSRPGEARR